MAELEPSVQEQISDELDKALLKAIKASEPNATMLNVARQRCRDLGLTKIILPGDPVKQMADELGLEDPTILKMPPLSDEPDTATA